MDTVAVELLLMFGIPGLVVALAVTVLGKVSFCININQHLENNDGH